MYCMLFVPCIVSSNFFSRQEVTPYFNFLLWLSDAFRLGALNVILFEIWVSFEIFQTTVLCHGLYCGLKGERQWVRLEAPAALCSSRAPEWQRAPRDAVFSQNPSSVLHSTPEGKRTHIEGGRIWIRKGGRAENLMVGSHAIKKLTEIITWFYNWQNI